MAYQWGWQSVDSSSRLGNSSWWSTDSISSLMGAQHFFRICYINDGPRRKPLSCPHLPTPPVHISARAPMLRFGNSKRGLLPGEESKGRQYAGKDSPGPVYRPNFESVSKKSPAPSLGGLH